jgi:DNA repair protein RadD
MYELRDYQQDALTALLDSIQSGCKAPLVCAPTGSGKSLLISALTKWIIEHEKTRVIIAADVKELVLQNFETLIKFDPDIDSGVYSAGLKSRDLDNDAIVASIQSIYRKGKIMKNIGYLLVDEAHKLSPESTTRYQKFISDLKFKNNDLVVVGFTATPFRLGQGMLTDGTNAIFEKIVYDIPIQRLVDNKYLAPLVTKGGIGKIDLSNVRTTSGDYNAHDLEVAATDEYLTEAAVREIIAYGTDRRAWLVFAAGVKHAKYISSVFRKYGIKSYTVYGEMSSHTRYNIITQFKSGKIPCVINVNLLITGFDYPEIDLIALLTATKSPNKYVQALGRGMRVAPGKQNCLVLDYGNNIMRLGPVDAINRIVRAKSSGDDMNSSCPMKECPEKTCRLLVHASTRTCPNCGYVWDINRISDRISTIKAYSGPVMASQDTPRWVPVMNAVYHRYNSSTRIPGSPQKADTLLVEFFVSNISSPIKMWLAFDSIGFPKDRAFAYADGAGGKARSINEALIECDTWNVPTAIFITRNRNNTRYWVVQKWRWGEDGIQTLKSQSKFIAVPRATVYRQ